MNQCEKEFDDSFKNIVFNDNDGAIYVWREAWRKATLYFADHLEWRAKQWEFWEDGKMMSTELKMLAESLRGELNE